LPCVGVEIFIVLDYKPAEIWKRQQPDWHSRAICVVSGLLCKHASTDVKALVSPLATTKERPNFLSTHSFARAVLYLTEDTRFL
jgi:hypothetical protein